MIYVLDTHVLIGYFIGSKRLKRKLREKIEEVRNAGGRLLVPTIVLAEALAIPEIHDRIIVATAKFYKAWILTKDKIIRESGEVEKL